MCHPDCCVDDRGEIRCCSVGSSSDEGGVPSDEEGAADAGLRRTAGEDEADDDEDDPDDEEEDEPEDELDDELENELMISTSDI